MPSLLWLAVTDPLRSMIHLMSRYGDVVEAPIAPGKKFFILASPEHAEHVLVSHNDHYETAFTYKPLRAWIGLGLITSDGDLWERQRRLIQPMFSYRRVAALVPSMAGATKRMLERWNSQPNGTVIDAADAMSSLTLDIVGRALFSADFTDDGAMLNRSVAVLQDAASKIVRNPLTWVSTRLAGYTSPQLQHWLRAMRAIDAVIARTITARRTATPTGPPRDLLDALVTARDEDGSGIADEQIRDEIITFFMAGHETSANCLAWTLYLLSTTPDARHRLEEEVDAVLSGRVPDLGDVDALVWTKAVLSESMRLYPPVWTVERDAIHDDSVDGVLIPAGSTVAVPPYLVHRHPGVWPDPEGFDPERFLQHQAAGRHRYAFIPYGAGRRGCIGNIFALLELVIALAMITQRYRLDLLPGFDPYPKVTVTLRPRTELSMTLVRRF